MGNAYEEFLFAHRSLSRAILADIWAEATQLYPNPRKARQEAARRAQAEVKKQSFARSVPMDYDEAAELFEHCLENSVVGTWPQRLQQAYEWALQEAQVRVDF